MAKLKGAAAQHAAFVAKHGGRAVAVPPVKGVRAPALQTYKGELPGQKRGATTSAKCKAPTPGNPLPSNLFLVGRELAAKHGLKQGAYLRICTEPGGFGITIPVKDASDALAKHARVKACVGSDRAKMTRCASEVSALRGLGSAPARSAVPRGCRLVCSKRRRR